jgi:hypothetical protein
MVVDYVRSFRLQEIKQARIVEIHLYQMGLRVDMFPLAGAQIVHDQHLVAPICVCIYYVGGNEPRAPGDQDLHLFCPPPGLVHTPLL